MGLDLGLGDKLNNVNKNMSIQNKELLNTTKKIPLADIDLNEKNEIYSINGIEELAQSIQVNGLLNPLIVKVDQDNKFKLISGHRRYNALVYLEEGYAECIVIDRDLTDEEESILLIESNNYRQKSKEELKQEIIRKKKLYKKLKEENPEKYKSINVNKLVAEEVNVSESTVKRAYKDMTESKEEKEEHDKKTKLTPIEEIVKLKIKISKLFSQIEEIDEEQITVYLKELNEKYM